MYTKTTAPLGYHLEKLDPYKTPPLDQNSIFFKNSVGEPPIWTMFNKKKWLKEQSNAYVLYSSVIKSHESLWSPSKSESGFAVILFTIDPRYRCDKEWLTTLTRNLNDLRYTQNIPEDCKEIVSELKKEKNSFQNLIIGNSITNGIRVYCSVVYLSAKKLPNNCLPQDSIVPFINIPTSENEPYLKEIPPEYYC